MSSIQMLGDGRIYKTRVDDMDQRDILLVWTGETLNEAEKILFRKASPWHEGPEFSLASLPVHAFNEDFSPWQEAVLQQTDSLPFGDRVRSNVASELILYKDFEAQEAEHSFTGSGARYMKEGYMELFHAPFFETYGRTELEISFWLYTDHRTHGMPKPELFKVNKEGKRIHTTVLESRAVHDVDGLWVRISHRMTPEEGVNYQLVVRGDYITVDDLLVKPAHAHVAVLEDGRPLLFDNFRLRLDQQH
jgi:hypothetical protein